MILGVVSGLSLVLVGLLCWKVTERAADGRLALNALAGIRTTATLSSEAAWLAGHAAALPTMKAVCLWSCVLGVVMAVWGVFLPLESAPVPLVVLFGVGYLGLLLGLGRAAAQANRAAKAVQA